MRNDIGKLYTPLNHEPLRSRTAEQWAKGRRRQGKSIHVYSARKAFTHAKSPFALVYGGKLLAASCGAKKRRSEKHGKNPRAARSALHLGMKIRVSSAFSRKKIHGQRFGLHAGRGDIARQFRMFTASSMGSSPPSTEMKPLCQFRMFTEKTPRSMGRLSVRRYVPTAYCSASK
ncbi:hypothetical protein GC56T2_1287 [Geobacillus sp. C56-T2]|nr:hypothetical protein GC56T2_1287 [Geobacillus sp. C56-T2]